MSCARLRSRWLASAFTLHLLSTFSIIPPVAAAQPTYLEQSFYFDWNPPGTTVPIPTTQQCETIHITWQRGAATGPNPVAPYFLQIYTSAFTVPFIVPAGAGTTFDFQVPFIPGTLYQICMFASNGATGGCQAIYTVTTNVTRTNPSCPDVTAPGTLDVQAGDVTGSFSQYGWVAQCTDIAVTPKNGTPPYTFTVAPTLRPPLNITSQSMSTINWTDTLAFGLSYFISLADSQGNIWSQGPLHSAPGSFDCLFAETSLSKRPSIAVVSAGSVLGGLLVGAALAALGLRYYYRRRASKRASSHYAMSKGKGRISHYSDNSIDEAPSPYQSPLPTGRTPSTATHPNAHLPYQVEPFIMPSGGSGDPQQTPLLSSTSPPPNQLQAAPSSSSIHTVDASQASDSRRRPQVYVVHHDAGRAPVTVYTDDGAQITELPPSYNDERAPRQNRRLPRLLPRAEPGEVPRKTRDSAGGPSS